MIKINEINKTRLVTMFITTVILGAVAASLPANACSVLKPSEESQIKS